MGGIALLILLATLLALPACTHESYVLDGRDIVIDVQPDPVDPLPDPYPDPDVPDIPPPDLVDPPDLPPDCRDSDGDGVCDADDRCPGFDDRLDADGDGVPDACDCDHGGVVCHEDARCVETGTIPDCVCNPGFEGDGFHCSDIDECARGTAGCDPNATCTNTHGGFTCTCNEGYTGDGFTCRPVDHCAAGTHLCDPNATCAFTGPGTYTCTCNPGYLGDGFTCTPIDPDICISMNDGPLFDDGLSVGSGLLAMRFGAPSYLRITRCQVYTGESSAAATLGIWSHDYAWNRPLANLVTYGWSTLTSKQWQGPSFSAPVGLGAGPDYWLVWGAPAGAQSSEQTGGSLVEVRISSDGGHSWGAPTLRPMKLRCYCE